MNLIKKILSFGERGIYKKGIRLYNENKFEASITFFRMLIDRHPSSNSLNYSFSRFYCAQAYRNLGIASVASGDTRKALYYLKEALTLNSKHIDLFYFIGICENNLGNFEAAANAFYNILKIEPGDINTKLKLAVTFHNMNMWDKSISIYQAILEKKPDYADVHFKMGLARLGSGQTEDAVSAFKQALSINPNYTEARIKLGVVLVEIEQYDQAKEHFCFILQKNPDFADIHYYMGIIYLSENDLEKSLFSFRKAADINPGYLDAQIKLCHTLWKSNQFDAALAEMNRLKERFPENTIVDNILKQMTSFNSSNKGDNDFWTGEIDNIFRIHPNALGDISEFDKKLKIMPNFSEMLSLFDIQGTDGENESLARMLIPMIKDGIRQNPTYPDLHNSLGSFYEKLCQYEDAKKSYLKALSLNPDYIQARINLLELLTELNSWEDAIPHGEYLMAKQIIYPDVLCMIGEAFHAVSRDEDALVVVQKILKGKTDYVRANYLKARIYLKQNNPDLALSELHICMSSKKDMEISKKAAALFNKLK